jgi:RNA polymerase sigma-70 factor (ECF subfamily)
LTEKTFIESLKNSSSKEKAFRELMTLYKERLYWHIRKIVKIHEDADDVLQNTFIKVYRNIDTFKENAKLYSWMYRIATNESITFLNKRAKQNNANIEDYQHKLVDRLHADVHYDGDEIQLKLQKAISLLPHKQQLVFNMKYFDAMKYNDMSIVLDTSVGALKASYHHAVKKIELFITKTD